MAELHVLGEIVGGSQFEKKSLCCRWKFVVGEAWKTIEGFTEGQTQVDDPSIGSLTNWNHPIDVHFVTTGIQGWPNLHFQIYHYDSYSRLNLLGYACYPLPTSPGTHQGSCISWRPVGSFSEELFRSYLGGGVQLTDPESIHQCTDQYRLRTITAGTVHLQLTLVCKGFKQFGIEC